MSRRASSTIRVSVQLALIAALAALCAPFGCALSDTNGKGGGTQQTCKQGNDAQCDDGNPCHANTCSTDGVCETHVISGNPADTKPGDCHKTVCDAEGQPSVVADPNDADDDGDPCTTDACENGKTVHTPVREGGMCTDQGHPGACMSGVCEVPCSGGGDCSTPDKCSVGACDLASGFCKFMRLDGVPVPDMAPKVGDCQDLVCVKGATKSVDNPDDLPQVTDCYTPSCSGDPLKPGKDPKNKRAMCSAGVAHLCDGEGACVECIDPGDCVDPSSNPCHTPTCTAGVCSFPDTPSGPSALLSGMQTTGDCMRNECDGSGHVVARVDTGDAEDDGNPCTKDTCDASGGKHHDPDSSMNGHACGSNLSCMNGVCNGCTMNSQCPSSNPLEQCDMGSGSCVCPGTNPLRTCSSQGKTCGMIDNGCGTQVNCGGGKDGGETDTDCGGDANACATRCGNGGHCNANSDCANGHCVDNICCDTACTGGCSSCTGSRTGGPDGSCRAISSGGAPRSGCGANGTCGNTGSCDGTGNCQQQPTSTQCGTTCMSATQTNNHCNGAGNCVGGSTVGCAPYQCNSAMTSCLTMCSNGGDCTSGNTCSGGACGTTKPNGAGCSSGTECQSTNCVDNVCCGSSCTGACMACNLPGNVGTCSPIGSNTQDPGVCDDSHGGCGGCSGCGTQCACNGSGSCAEKNGQNCTCDANCASGKCGAGGSNCSNPASHQCD